MFAFQSFGKKQRTPLYDAVLPLGSPEVVDVLLNFGADLNYRDKQGVTPTHFAAMYGSTGCLTTLLARYPNPGVRTTLGPLPGLTAMDIANVMVKREGCRDALVNNERVVETLLKSNDVGKLVENLANHYRSVVENQGMVSGVGGAWCNHKGQSLVALAAMLGLHGPLRTLLQNAATEQMKEFPDDFGWTRTSYVLRGVVGDLGRQVGG